MIEDRKMKLSAGSAEFKKKYGGIKVAPFVDIRRPVIRPSYKDPNRSLMLKFKYGTLSGIDADIFHEKLKRLIYRAMHSNNIMMDWDDVYQEIWKKIIRSRHTWKEYKGTMVSTWITIVANSVINSLRKSVARYNSRYCLYEDIGRGFSCADDCSSSAQEKMDAVCLEQNGREGMCDSAFDADIRRDSYREFINSLDCCERLVIERAISISDKILDAHEHDARKRPSNELRECLGYDEVTFNGILYGIRRKYCEIFGKEMDDGRVFKIPVQGEADKNGNGFLL